jgi:hypothetical protein
LREALFLVGQGGLQSRRLHQHNTDGPT